MTSSLTDRLNNAFAGGAAIKSPCRVASTGNLTLSSYQTIDGIAIGASDTSANLNTRILVKNQTNSSENGIYCLDSDTEILTKAGFKNYADLNEGEDVLTLNMDTGLAEWQPALAVHSFQVGDTEMLSVEMSGHSSLSTMNHRWPVSRRSPPVEKFPRKHYADGTFAPWEEPIPDGPYLTVRQSHELNSEDYIILSAKCANLPAVKTYEDAFVELVGWFITEGYIRKNNSGSLSNCVKIVQSCAVNQPYVDRIRNCLTTLFGDPTTVMRRPRDGAWKPEWRETVKASDRMVEFSLNREAGKMLCEVAPGKVAKAEFVSALTEDQLHLFIDACICADGSINSIGGQKIFTQKRFDMLAPVQMACTLAGIATSVSVTKDGIHIMTLRKRERTAPGTHGKTIRWSGTVWCPQTKNTTWLARRNGSVYFTGNTMDTGAWSRTRDFDGARDVFQGTLVWVSTGASQGGGFYNVTNSDPITPDGSSVITFAAADVFTVTTLTSCALSFASCAAVAAASAYVAAGSAYVAAGSAYVAAASAYVAAGSAVANATSAATFSACAFVAAGSAITNAASAATAASSAYVAAASAYVAAGSAYVAAGSAYVAAGSAYVAAGSAYVAAGSAYVAASCAYAAASCAGDPDTVSRIIATAVYL